MPDSHRSLVTEALDALGVTRWVLSIHDPSFPGLAGEDLGRGSPYSEGAARFLAFARDLGFTGIQLGPQGQTTAHNPSPYDGTLFSRNTLNVALAPLTDPHGPWGALLSPGTLARLASDASADDGPEARYHSACRGQALALQEAWDTFRRTREPGLVRRFEGFRAEHREWLERDALFDVLATRHHTPDDWRSWADSLEGRLFAPRPGEVGEAEARIQELLTVEAEAVEQYAFRQFLVSEQHGLLRERAGAWGLKLYGDLQIGFSPRDTWARQGLFLRAYLMGAPPSRTNPEGQPWNYPVLDPEQYVAPDGSSPGPVLRFMDARLSKMLSEYDGLRIDHPHGLVCPWVYRAGSVDPLRAVQGGARLFSSPDLPDHPELARYSIVAPEQLDRSVSRHADGWVKALTEEQVGRYAILFDSVVRTARERGRAREDVLCEVLSTLPYELSRVMARDGLGRFRVTQKADLSNPADVYRSENVAPEDWVMVGNHDTKSLWRLVSEWQWKHALRAQADYLAERLHPEAEGREAFARQLAQDPGLLAQAKFADLFASRARSVMVFFADLLGMPDTYNAPGSVDARNWSLRIPPDWAAQYQQRLRADAALNLPQVLAMALRAGGAEARARHADLLTRLDGAADQLRGGER
ncbi:4-alpha-glucanotransferase [Corallococcus aberystwythensis]|uniref:4-alpha-glucanotransferase n=1 Tax=Corallococcus aberystwythensis TaxID=2316722 RepID=A0A3A8QQI2_9BACT|nr:4-alpha-glucanotransferase [Corallococcus aberystwythensis]